MTALSSSGPNRSEGRNESGGRSWRRTGARSSAAVCDISEPFSKASYKPSVNQGVKVPHYGRFLSSFLALVGRPHMIHRSLLQKHLALVYCKNSSFAGSSTRGRVQTQGRSKQLAGSVVTDLGRHFDDVQVPFATAQRADFQKKTLKKTSKGKTYRQTRSVN